MANLGKQQFVTRWLAFCVLVGLTSRVTTQTTPEPCCSRFVNWARPSSYFHINEDLAPGSSIGTLPSQVCSIRHQGEVGLVDGQVVFLGRTQPDLIAQYDFNVSFCECPGYPFPVTVYVDKNKAPVFQQTVYRLEIVEGSLDGFVVGNFPAEDLDTDASNLVYEILSEPVKTYLNIGQFGVVKIWKRMWLQQLLTNNILLGRSDRSFSFKISVSDGNRTAYSLVQTTILSPLRTLVTYTEKTVSISEEQPPGTLVTNVWDILGKRIPLPIRQTSGQDYFQIDAISGNVTSLLKFDRETRTSYSILVDVYSTGSTEIELVLELVVIIDDINDNDPEFSQATYECRVPELSTTLHGLIVAVSDADSGANATVDLDVTGRYRDTFLAKKIPDSSSFNGFSIDVIKPDVLDYEGPPIRVNLTAVDVGVAPRTAKAELTITLLDVNDNAPVFDNSSYMLDVPANASRVFPILTVRATDRDSSANAAISYHLLSGAKGKVSLDEISGKIRLSPDVQAPDSIAFQILARDNGLPSLSSVAGVSIFVRDVGAGSTLLNPRFSEAFYTTTVVEEGMIEFGVIAVTASDTENLHFGSILYQMGQFILGPPGQIQLNSTTGIVRFTSQTDYEIPEQRFFLFTVLASVPDVQSTTATTTVFIELKPKNDEPPVFTETEYVVNEPFDGSPDFPITNIWATDSDRDPRPSILTYSLGPELDAATFAIDAKTGLIRQNIFRRLGSNYTFSVLASDGSKEGKANVTVVRSLEFIQSLQTVFLNISIAENTSVKDVLYTFPPNQTQTIKLYGPSDVFAINQQQDMELVLMMSLDRETQSSYSLMTTGATTPDGNRLEYFKYVINVDITDVNDNPPTCDKPFYSLHISTLSTVSKFIIVTDPDLQQLNSWSAKMSNYEHIFEFSGNRIRLIADRSTLTEPIYDFTLLLTDGDDPSLTSTCYLHVEVDGTNPISIAGIPTEISVLESVPVESVILTAKASLRIPQGSPIFRYSLTDSMRYLSINDTSGEVMVNRTLDFETDRSFTVDIFATGIDQSLVSASTTLTVKVKDYNDNVPVFGKMEYYVDIRHEMVLGKVLLTVTATDPDSGPNGDVKYDIEECGLGKSYFNIDGRTGNISLSKPLELLYFPNISFVVVAMDSGQFQRSSRAVVTVTIPNFNLHAPQFAEAFYYTPNLTITEGVVDGSVITVRAFDSDVNDTVSYFLAKSTYSDYFHIGPLSGEIRTVRALDREEVVAEYQNTSQSSRRRRQAQAPVFCTTDHPDKIPLTVVAVDNGFPQRTANICVLIVVLDVNDNRPIFNTTEITLSFNPSGQNLEAGLKRQINALATDLDKGDNQHVYYAISSRSNYFVINNETGEIKVEKDCIECAKSTDYELEQLTIYAYNQGDAFEESKNLSQFLTVHVRLRCSNCGLTTTEIITISLSCALGVVVIILIIVLCRQWKRHQQHKKDIDNKNLKKIRQAAEVRFQVDTEYTTYDRPDAEYDNRPMRQPSRDGYLQPSPKPSGQSQVFPSNHANGRAPDEGYLSVESDLNRDPRPQVRRGVPRMTYFGSRNDGTRDYMMPLSTGYSNRLASE